MSALEVLSQPLWQHLAWTLLHFVWQGALVGIALLLLLSLLRPAQARYLAALAALLVMITAPLATLAWQLSLPATKYTLTEAVASADEAALFAETSRSPSRSWNALVSVQLQALQPYVVLAWMLGVSLLSLRLLVSYIGVRRLRRSSALLTAQRLPMLPILKHRLRIGAAVRAAASATVREAMVIGLWRPLILIPAAWLTEMPAPTLEAILAHELAHIRRHDLWVNLLQRITETLLFYHPAVWYVSRVLRVEREKCCDELAVAATGQRLAYVEALELVAHRRLAASPSVWATAMGGARTMNLLERVRNVLGLRPATSAGQYWPVGIAALLLPLGLWCVTAAVSPSVKADDGDKPRTAEEKKDGEKKDGERKEEPRKEESRREEARKEEPRKEEPRREEPRREGDRPREGERRPEGAREGDRGPDRPREGDRRPDGPRPGERGPDRPREGDRRPDGQPPFPPDLMRVIMELRMEVQQLRREVNELRERGPRPGGPRPDGPRPDGPRPDGPRPDGPRPDGPRREGEVRRPDGARPEGDRPRPDRPRGEGDRPRPDGDRI